MRMPSKWYWLIGLPIVLIVGVVAIGLAVFWYASLPLVHGARFASNSVTIVSDGWGPVAIGAYVVELGDGKVGLVDATMDPEAGAVLSVLNELNKTPDDVQAIFFTHGHDDHTDGALAFPDADLYTLELRIPRLERLGRTLHVMEDGDRVDFSGVTVEVFELPGHTPGSAAYLVHGVLFLGDSAASLSDGSLAPNRFISEDADRSEAALRELAQRLRERRDEINHIAFGHQGPVEGLDPLLDWAEGR